MANRYLFRVQYDRSEQAPTYESVVVIAADEARAREDVYAATDRFTKAVNATRTLTLLQTWVEP